MSLLKTFRPAPLLDGYHVNNYVELLEALPIVNGRHAMRLLNLEAGAAGSPLQATLTRHFIDDCPPYEALSYTWKSASFTEPIKINGSEFHVTGNVENALLNLRYEDKPRCIWVDSICIDQRNLIEKNAQVALMNKIYSGSQGVVCWIGLEQESEDDLKSGEQMDIAKSFDLARDIGKHGWEKYPELIASHPPEAVFTLIKLTERSYFRRQWVIQEVCLAKKVTVQVKQHKLDWAALAASAEGMARFGDDQRASLLFPGSNRIFDLYGIRAMEFCREKSDHGHFSNDLIDLLRTCRGRELTDPRDMVYSLLAICGPESMHVEIDYRKSVRTLYNEVTAEVIRRARDLDFLRLADHRSRDEGLPSWSPNWTGIWAGSWQIRSLRFKGYPPTEGRIVPGSDDVVFSEDLLTLTLKGKQRYTITQVQSPGTIPADPQNTITDEECYEQLATTLIQIEYLITYTPRKTQSKEARRVEFVDSLFHAFTGGQHVGFTPEDFAAWYEIIVQRLTDDLPDDKRAVWSQYNAKLLKWLHEAQYFLTDAGVIGVAERVSKIQPGDVIVTLKGGSDDSLFVVRQLEESKYELINGVYLHFDKGELEEHVRIVDGVNAGDVKTVKYSLV